MSVFVTLRSHMFLWYMSLKWTSQTVYRQQTEVAIRSQCLQATVSLSRIPRFSLNPCTRQLLCITSWKVGLAQ
jgi:hypothetical protein